MLPLHADFSQGANDWTRPPKMTTQTGAADQDEAWKLIKEKVEKIIKFVAVNADGTQVSPGRLWGDGYSCPITPGDCHVPEVTACYMPLLSG